MNSQIDYKFLAETKLFQGVQENELKAMMNCLKAHEKEYKKDELIFHAGETVTEVGLVLEGSVNIVVNFYWGDSNIFGHVEKGRIFAETYAALPEKELICDVVAAEKCRVLFMSMNHLLTSCHNSCGFHQSVIHNLIRIAASQNLNLSSRMMHTAPKSIRGKLMSYFSELVVENGGNRNVVVPFSRQQLADYLGVDRSALSGELSKMQKEGLLTYKKNEFQLLQNP